MALPVNVDSTYADSGTDASVALHQQHHDSIHSAVNKLPGWSGPGLYGMQAWTLDPGIPFGGSGGQSIAGGGGTLYLMGFYTPIPLTVTSLVCRIGTAGSGLTAGLLGLYNSSGSRLGLTADQSSAWASTGVKTMALTSSASVPAGINFAARISTGTTQPQMTGSNNADALFTNIGMSTSVFRGGFLSGQTTLPTSITLTGFSTTAAITFVGMI